MKRCIPSTLSLSLFMCMPFYLWFSFACQLFSLSNYYAYMFPIRRICDIHEWPSRYQARIFMEQSAQVLVWMVNFSGLNLESSFKKNSNWLANNLDSLPWFTSRPSRETNNVYKEWTFRLSIANGNSRLAT